MCDLWSFEFVKRFQWTCEIYICNSCICSLNKRHRMNQLHGMQINIHVSMQCIMQFNAPHLCEMVEAMYIILMYRMFACSNLLWSSQNTAQLQYENRPPQLQPCNCSEHTIQYQCNLLRPNASKVESSASDCGSPVYQLINKGISYCEQERTFADRRHLEEEIFNRLASCT